MTSDTDILVTALNEYAKVLAQGIGGQPVNPAAADLLTTAAKHYQFLSDRLEGAMQENSELRFENQDLLTKLGQANAPVHPTPGNPTLPLEATTDAIVKNLETYAENFSKTAGPDDDQSLSGIFTIAAQYIKAEAILLGNATQENATLKRQNEYLKVQLNPVKLAPRVPRNTGPSFGI